MPGVTNTWNQPMLNGLFVPVTDERDDPDLNVTGDLPDRLAGAMMNPVNTNIVRHANCYLARWEAGPPTEVTAALDTVGVHDFSGRLDSALTAGKDGAIRLPRELVLYKLNLSEGMTNASG